VGSGALKTLRDMMSGREQDPFKDRWHIACACSYELTQCGGIVPGVTGVFLASIPQMKTCCPACRETWYANGCLLCDCKANNLCALCRASIEEE